MLYIVATPIGNLQDISLRALDTLRSVDLIAAEDTRHSQILLRHFQIEKQVLSYHEHNEARRTAELLERLRNGTNVALITDAGMPGISDPGHRLLRACIEQQIAYTIVPGASAVLAALIGSGFAAEQFFFGGFLPVKTGQREREIRLAGQRAGTSIYFESPHRLVRTLEVFAREFPERKLCVAREMTKRFEEFRTGTAPELLEHYSARAARGEITLVVSGA